MKIPNRLANFWKIFVFHLYQVQSLGKSNRAIGLAFSKYYQCYPQVCLLIASRSIIFRLDWRLINSCLFVCCFWVSWVLAIRMNVTEDLQKSTYCSFVIHSINIALLCWDFFVQNSSNAIYSTQDPQISAHQISTILKGNIQRNYYYCVPSPQN